MALHQTFFKEEVPKLLDRLQANDKPSWGVMSATLMVDHLLAGTRLFMSKIETKLETPEELLPKYKAFLMSDRTFKQSAQQPAEYNRFESDEKDFNQLRKEFLEQLAAFDQLTAHDDSFWSFHPSFGKLNAEETRQLQYKHIRHHFVQFGLMEL